MGYSLEVARLGPEKFFCLFFWAVKDRVGAGPVDTAGLSFQQFFKIF